jgi:hypothetical protein
MSERRHRPQPKKFIRREARLTDEYGYLFNFSAIVFFADQCLSGRAIPRALTEASGYAAELFAHHFDLDTPDVDWLPEIGDRRWILVTKDRHIEQRPLEREAIINAKVRAFILTERNMSSKVMVALLKHAMPRMLSVIDTHQAPFIFGIDLTGTLTQLG